MNGKGERGEAKVKKIDGGRKSSDSRLNIAAADGLNLCFVCRKLNDKKNTRNHIANHI